MNRHDRRAHSTVNRRNREHREKAIAEHRERNEKRYGFLLRLARLTSLTLRIEVPAPKEES